MPETTSAINHDVEKQPWRPGKWMSEKGLGAEVTCVSAFVKDKDFGIAKCVQAVYERSMPADETIALHHRGLAAALVRRAIRRLPSAGSKGEIRLRLGLLQGWCVVIANSLVFLTKLILGIYLSSISLMADAVDSLFDMMGGVIIIASAHWVQKPKDMKHPYGHGRMDLISSLIMAVLLIVAGVELARTSLMRILHPIEYSAPWWLVAVVAATIPIKEWLTVLSHIVSEETQATTHRAGYWYQRFDSLTTSTVCLGLVLSRLGQPAVDGWIGLGIALWIGRTGVLLAKSAISPLLGEAATEQEVNAVLQVAASQEGVHNVHGVLMHKYGDTKVVSLHIEVDASKSADELHEVAERVESEVEHQTECRAIVHVDPIDRSHPLYERVQREVKKAVAGDDRVLGFHDLRVSGNEKSLSISLDLVIGLEVDAREAADVEAKVVQALRKAFPDGVSVRATLEGSYLRGAAT